MLDKLTFSLGSGRGWGPMVARSRRSGRTARSPASSSRSPARAAAWVAQAKPGRRVDLPLLKDVGWAIIDYVRDGRPDSDCPQVFLRHTAPIGPFSDQDHLHQILVKHARTAHVPLGEQRRHGMHSL